MKPQENSCCEVKEEQKGRAIVSGILLGMVPHSFCVAFILFSIIGAVAATAFLKNALMIPYFFPFLITISFLLATISSAIYLKQNGCLCVAGIKSKWKYVMSVYAGIIIINTLMFFVVFPALANIDSGTPKEMAGIQKEDLSQVTISTQIPCSGHAPLIVDEIKKNNDVYSVTFSMPDTFNITYDPKKTTPEKILSLGIFETFKATIIN
jgi:hypothetical protein